MIGRIETFIRKIRRGLSRSEWMIHFLRLKKLESEPSRPGLILIQIDGLAMTQFQRALKDDNLPFLKRLIRREHYIVHPHYSGVPSSTPAVQGEIFYGVPGCVPAFKFLHHQSGRFCTMYEPDGAAAVESDLEKVGTPFLKGGSAYGDIFKGGAAESHFCASSLSWKELFSTMNPMTLAATLFFQAHAFIRAIVLLCLEFLLALWDCVRGIFSGKSMLQEIMFIVTRVSVCILLREMISAGVKIDAARGLPVIHANFIGYDEQAHRRGPASAFAHWSLQGIDAAIAQIWRAAQLSTARHYDVWVYSDHGQQETIPYAFQHGRSVESAVEEIFKELKPETPDPSKPAECKVSAMGPLGQVYPPRKLEPEERERLARRLVDEAKIPLVLAKGREGEADAWTAEGKFLLPRDAEKILGEGHPFLREASHDLVKVCHHADSGEFVISGWTPEGMPTSFPNEHGSHGGPGPEETHAFALLPMDTVLPLRSGKHLRPVDLREAAMYFLGKAGADTAQAVRFDSDAPKTIRIMTYNVHSCIGMDGKISPERIARVIARHRPDIVALQELDIGRARTGGVDQAEAIAMKLNMMFHFQPAIRLEEEQYGDAILSRYPMTFVKAGPLSTLPHRSDLEPRGALWVAVDVGGVELQVINTHLSLWRRECQLQAEELTGSEWLGHSKCAGPVVLCGDFNSLPASPVCMEIGRCLRDAQLQIKNRRPQKTFSGRYPMGRIDHVFVSPDIRVVGAEVPGSELEKVSSDHLPLIVEIALPSASSVRDIPEDAAGVRDAGSFA